MPMPAPKSPWPLPEFKKAIDAIRYDDAVISGRLDVINDHRRDATKARRPYTARGQYNGGLVGATTRAFLGRPSRGVAASESHMISHHLPIADELVTAMADHMAGKPPLAKLAPEDEGNTRAAEALEKLVTSDQFAADWWHAVHKAGALGWVFGRVVWNEEVQPDPWIQWVDADGGMAEFENGRQVAVLFWDTFKKADSKTVHRLLQRHTPGQIEYQLFEGEEDNLGMVVPFTDCPETAYLAELEGLRDGTTLVTGASMPTAHMMGNYRPRHEWRHLNPLRYYAVSDVARAGSIFEVIDTNWSQLQHEIEAARGRVMVSEDLLETGNPGDGQFFDWWRDLYPVAQGAAADAKPTIEQIQFNMRVEEYLKAIDAGIRKAISAVGLSPFTVDMDPAASGDMTATETRARTKRTRQTAETKGRMQRAHLSALLTSYLEMDAALNNYPAPTRPVVVSLPDNIEISEREMSDQVVTQHNAGVMSLGLAVRKLHPEFTPDEVKEEIAAIKAETSYAPDPFHLPDDVNPDPAQQPAEGENSPFTE